MSGFLGEHTYCYMCGLKVTPGVYHECKKTESFIPSTSTTFWCAWCQMMATPIADRGMTRCSNCGHGLHGAVANPVFSVMHRPSYNHNWY